MKKPTIIKDFKDAHYLIISMNYGATVEENTFETCQCIDELVSSIYITSTQLNTLENGTPGTYIYDKKDHVVVIKLK